MSGFLEDDKGNKSSKRLNQTIIVWGAIEAKPEHFDQVLALSLEHVHRSRLEAGCISHSVNIDAENSMRLVFFEEWQDMAALQAHFALPASNEFVRSVNEMAAESAEMRIFEASEVG